MKNSFKKIMVAVGLLAALALPLKTEAAGFYESFQATNVLNFTTTSGATTIGTNIVSWPTNSLSTNGNGQLTGHQIAIFNQNEIGFRVQGWLTNNAAAVMAVFLTVSGASDSPFVSTNTITGGNTNIYGGTGAMFGRNDWSQNTYMLNIALPALTNWFDFETNIPNTTIVGMANWVGIYQVTNNLAAGNFLTNAQNNIFGIVKKVRPVTLQ